MSQYIKFPILALGTFI